MAIPQNKEELLADIQRTYLMLREDLNTVPTKITTELMLEGHARGTRMSVTNLISYLIGWGELVLKWHQKKNAEEPVDFPETGYKWNELGKLAQKFYKDYEDLDYPALLLRLDTNFKDLQQLIISYDNKGLYEKA
jgi:hypothetical protein